MLARLSPHGAAALRGAAAGQGRIGQAESLASRGVGGGASSEASGSRLAVSDALKVEEASLLRAEEGLLLQRRAAEARAIAQRART